MLETKRVEPLSFAETLYAKMARIFAGVGDLEPYEFCYGLDNHNPVEGWDSIELDRMEEIEKRVNSSSFYNAIQLKQREGDQIVLDKEITRLTRMLFVGLVSGEYPEEWICKHFYFDVRGFYFLHRTLYFSEAALAHLNQKPYRSFEQKQKNLEQAQAVGYKEFRNANAEVDQCFIEILLELVEQKGTPILVAIAGATAAGKTEIVARLQEAFEQNGKKITTIEMDHFLTDRDDREAKGIDSLGKEALHYEIFKECLSDICQGKKIATPRYDFVRATSSHTVEGELKPGYIPIEVSPADIIFIEGNFPFLLPEVAHLIGIKVVYLTDDAMRMKRKWKRDMDYRKKYELGYFLNRYFKDQFLMAEKAYIPQMEICDLVVDTTGAAIWTTPEISECLDDPTKRRARFDQS